MLVGPSLMCKNILDVLGNKEIQIGRHKVLEGGATKPFTENEMDYNICRWWTVGLNVGLARDRGGFLLTENNKARTDEVKMKPQPPQGPGMRILRKLCPTFRGSREVTAQWEAFLGIAVTLSLVDCVVLLGRKNNWYGTSHIHAADVSVPKSLKLCGSTYKCCQEWSLTSANC